MTEEQVLEIITRVAARLSPKYVFGYFGREDIEQEAILMGYDALTRWDGVRPLENFVYTHINNRLKTFKRDNYYRLNAGSAEAIQQAKKNIMDPISIDSVNVLKLVPEDEYAEARAYIDDFLPVQYRKDYLRLCCGVKISKPVKLKVLSVLSSLLKEYHENRPLHNI